MSSDAVLTSSDAAPFRNARRASLLGAGLTWLDRSQPTAAGARELATTPPVQAINFSSLAQRFGAVAQVAAAPVAARYTVQGVVVDGDASRAVLLSDKADAKPQVVRVGAKLLDGARVASITRDAVVISNEGGTEEKLAVPKRADVRSAGVASAMAPALAPAGALFNAPPPPPPVALPTQGAAPPPVANPANIGLPGASVGNVVVPPQKPQRLTPSGP
jgi:hypothetical protein